MLKLIALLIVLLVIYTAVTFTRAIMPQMISPDEIKSPQITTDATGQRYLQMEVYTGHSGLNPEGATFKEKQGNLVVTPVYCLIDAPVTLCKPKVKTEFLEAPATPVYSAARLKLPDKPNTVILKFRDGSELVVQE